MDVTNGILQAVKDYAPILGQQPVAVWDAACEGAQRAADIIPEGMGLEPIKHLIHKHPIIATCAVLAIGGFLSLRGLTSKERALRQVEG